MADQPQQPPQPPQLPPGAAEAMREMAISIAEMVASFAPHLDDQQLMKLAQAAMQVQSQLGPVINDALDPQSRLDNPYWGVKITNLQTGEAVRVKTFKDISRLNETGEFVDFVVTLGLALTPVCRAVLAAYGMGVEFFQMPESTIIQPN
jgi:hypothetical protein